MTSEPTKRRPWPTLTLVFILVPLALVAFVSVMITLGVRASTPPTGPPLAVFEIRSGEPFEHPITSSGGTLQVWLDAECEDCSYPIEGAMRLLVNGRAIESTEISAGSTKRGGWESGRKILNRRHVFEADVPSAGTPMALAGILTVQGGRDYFTRKVKANAPPPRINLLRLTVTK
jgi:hypothetical protein